MESLIVSYIFQSYIITNGVFVFYYPLSRLLVSHAHGTRHFWETSGDSNPIIIQNRRPLGRNHYTPLLEMVKGC